MRAVKAVRLPWCQTIRQSRPFQTSQSGQSSQTPEKIRQVRHFRLPQTSQSGQTYQTVRPVRHFRPVRVVRAVRPPRQLD